MAASPQQHEPAFLKNTMDLLSKKWTCVGRNRAHLAGFGEAKVMSTMLALGHPSFESRRPGQHAGEPPAWARDRGQRGGGREGERRVGRELPV